MNCIALDKKPDIGLIEDIILNVCGHWRDIGQKLGLTMAELNALTRQPPKESMKGVLNYWADGKHKRLPYTWESFIAALRESGMSSLANDLEGID